MIEAQAVIHCGGKVWGVRSGGHVYTYNMRLPDSGAWTRAMPVGPAVRRVQSAVRRLLRERR